MIPLRTVLYRMCAGTEATVVFGGGLPAVTGVVTNTYEDCLVLLVDGLGEHLIPYAAIAYVRPIEPTRRAF